MIQNWLWTDRLQRVAAFVLLSALPAIAEQPQDAMSVSATFESQVAPFLEQYCFDCHNVDNMESGIRVDRFDGQLSGRTPFLWSNIRRQVLNRKMPPEDLDQPTDEQREQLVAWIDDALVMAKRRPRPKDGSIRRLTVSQYQNSLADLLGILDDYSGLLPPDAVSKDGFLNNERSMNLSPLLLEAYLKVAEKALDRCIVDEQAKPTIQNVRLDFGRNLNPAPYPDELILGPNNLLLRNQDFVVTQPRPAKSFEYNPFQLRTKFRFIEGYQGNATVRGWKSFDSIYHSVYACMRGDRGYPKGEAYSVIPDGLLLRPAIPNIGQFGVSTTYGPKANFKVSMRQLPDHGDLRVTVTAARYDDGLLLNRSDSVFESDDATFTADLADSGEANLIVDTAGIYQINVVHLPGEEAELLQLTLGDRHFSGHVSRAKSDQKESAETEADSNSKTTEESLATSPFMAVRLQSGPLRITARYGDNRRLRGLAFHAVESGHPVAERFATFERQIPTLGAFLGLRRDCGSTQSPFGELHRVSSSEFQVYRFQDAINNHPSPDVEEDNVNYLAGLREVGIRSLHTDGRDMPRVLIKSVQIEGPFYESWPPAEHTAILATDDQLKPADQARQIIDRFATKAFRRPLEADELQRLMNVWRESISVTDDFQQSIRDALLVAMTSPQFLFLIERSETADAELIGPHELASKLSYFLWNGPPDERLLRLASDESLHGELADEVKRMIYDDRFDRFVDEFVSQWLSLDKLDVVETDRKRYPKLISSTKTELRKEPVALIRYLLQQNRPLSEFVRSDYVVANEVVAKYYGIDAEVEIGFDFVPVKHQQSSLGGVLSNAAILAGLSDGRESNPVKRGAWLARKIIAEPPADPPPNVPDLPEDAEQDLTLRERLEQHRNQKGCLKCHMGIDPWGLPLEEYDAGGLLKDHPVDSSSQLPDETTVQGMAELKDYLASDRIDQVAFSFLKHVATYATGRNLSYNEIEFLREAGLQLRADGYRMQDMLQFVVSSPLFLEK